MTYASTYYINTNQQKNKFFRDTKLKQKTKTRYNSARQRQQNQSDIINMKPWQQTRSNTSYNTQDAEKNNQKQI